MRLAPARNSLVSVGLRVQSSLKVRSWRVPLRWSPPPGKLLPSVVGLRQYPGSIPQIAVSSDSMMELRGNHRSFAHGSIRATKSDSDLDPCKDARGSLRGT